VSRLLAAAALLLLAPPAARAATPAATPATPASPRAAAAAPVPPPPATAARPDLRPPPPATMHGETACERCHSPEQWGDVAFAHERTGFPLRGEHKKVGCKVCHPVDFQRALNHDCGACHRDPHRGQLGIQCQGCHDEGSWKSRFDADAHRRTGFPLTGRHAFLACEECHGNRLDRGFARAVSLCSDCHQRDLQRGQAVLDHGGFGTDCRRCHTPWRFQNAFFPDHEKCFALGGGPHAGIRCLDCHTSLTGTAASGACFTNTAACTRCHPVPEMQSVHLGANVLGFPSGPPYDRKCYECHRFSTRTGAALRGARSPR